MSLSQESLEYAVSLWDKDLVTPLLTSLRIAPGTAEHSQYINSPSSSYTEDHNPSGIPLYQPSYPTPQKVLRCSHCKTSFETREEQVAHYSLDWHRINLKRSMQGASAISYEQFNSGSWEKEEEENKEDSSAEEDEEDEEEDSSDEEDIPIQRKPRVFFVNADDELISIFRTILQHKKTEFSSEIEIIHRANAAPKKLYWIIILIGGGHFAGAVYKGPDVIAHKTFHSYTVRAKQGGTQSGRDNKNATSHPRSAGASLRRYNELSFNQHVQEIMEEWKEHITRCDLIFCRCPKTNNQLLFGDQHPFLSRSDYRFRTIPFPSKKPTFSEVKKVHRNLAQISVHGKLKNIMEMEREKLASKKSSSPSTPRGKKEEKSPKKLSKDQQAEIDTRQTNSSSSSEDAVTSLTTSFETINSGFLNPFGSSVEDAKSKKKHRKKKINHDNVTQDKIVNANESKESSKEQRTIENFVYSACRTGSLAKLEELARFAEQRDYTEVPDIIPKNVIESLLILDKAWDWRSIKFGTQEKTPLHVAAENAHKDLIWWLLDNGCSPCEKNKQNETPYVATKVKEAKNHFRRYVAAFPDKYDYDKANIPGPLTKQQETKQKSKQTEKKKQQKKAKQEKEKEVKKEEEKKRKEEEEKEHFLKLSDREKRALAAEKRMLTAQASKSQNVVSLRCFQCAKTLTNIIPFEYCDFKFCSTLCVKEHRTNSKPL